MFVKCLRRTHAEIAYLSACSTAEGQAARLVDEVLHVVSGFQVAGFRHVVCAKVAKVFYSKLITDGAVVCDDRAVAVHGHWVLYIAISPVVLKFLTKKVDNILFLLC